MKPIKKSSLPSKRKPQAKTDESAAEMTPAPVVVGSRTWYRQQEPTVLQWSDTVFTELDTWELLFGKKPDASQT